MGGAIQRTIGQVFLLIPWNIISYSVSKKVLKLNMRKKIWRYIVIFLVIYSALLIAISLYTPFWKMEYDPKEVTTVHDIVDRGLHYLSIIICTFLMINEKWYYIVLYAIASSSMFLMILILFMYLIEILVLILQLESSNIVIDTIYLIIIALLIIMIRKFVKHINKSDMIKQSNLSKRKHLYMYILIYLNMKTYGATIQVYSEENALNAIISIIYLIFILMQLFALIYLLNARIILKERNALNQSYLRLQEEHYQSIMEKDYRLRKLRHDTKHHLYMLRMLNEEGEREEIRLYLNTIAETLDKASSLS